jgi:hypothetical protein
MEMEETRGKKGRASRTIGCPVCSSGRRDMGRPKQRWKDEERLIEQFVMMMMMTTTTTMMMMMIMMIMIAIYK